MKTRALITGIAIAPGNRDSARRTIYGKRLVPQLVMRDKA